MILIKLSFSFSNQKNYLYLPFLSLNTINQIHWLKGFLLFLFYFVFIRQAETSQQIEGFKGPEEHALCISHICFFLIMCLNYFFTAYLLSLLLRLNERIIASSSSYSHERGPDTWRQTKFQTKFQYLFFLSPFLQPSFKFLLLAPSPKKKFWINFALSIAHHWTNQMLPRKLSNEFSFQLKEFFWMVV